MLAKPVIAIFDIGKTNKKLFLFDEDYGIVLERSVHFEETVDEDGDSCEDLQKLESWILSNLQELYALPEYEIKAVNFSAYGASFIYIGEDGNPVAPLYNYLKPYPKPLQQQFYAAYGGEEAFSFRTASPVLGSLNSGMQLYRLKYEKPQLFRRIKYALHLPQYMSYLFSGYVYSDTTSIGCHTNLWDFKQNDYHEWVYREGIAEKLPPVVPGDGVEEGKTFYKKCKIGVGLHDSSAALIPYLASFEEPFVLLSTGTWCISLNPFNKAPLTTEELSCDCLCYLSYKSSPVKASRLFAGHDHDTQVERIATFFSLPPDWYQSISYDPVIVASLKEKGLRASDFLPAYGMNASPFAKRDISLFSSPAEAYHQLLIDLVGQQVVSTELVLKEAPVKRLFVDGGFSKNALYMNLMASAFPKLAVFAASIAQASALGAAIAIHAAWNTKPLPHDLIQLKHYCSNSTLLTS